MVQKDRAPECLCSRCNGQVIGVLNVLLLGALAVPSQSVCLINAVACRACKLEGSKARRIGNRLKEQKCIHEDSLDLQIMDAPQKSLELSDPITTVHQYLLPPNHCLNSY